jgi:hypothetical protein
MECDQILQCSVTIRGEGEYSTATGYEIRSTNTRNRRRREATEATTQELVHLKKPAVLLWEFDV